MLKDEGPLDVNCCMCLTSPSISLHKTAAGGQCSALLHSPVECIPITRPSVPPVQPHFHPQLAPPPDHFI